MAAGNCDIITARQNAINHGVQIPDHESDSSYGGGNLVLKHQLSPQKKAFIVYERTNMIAKIQTSLVIIGNKRCNFRRERSTADDGGFN